MVNVEVNETERVVFGVDEAIVSPSVDEIFASESAETLERTTRILHLSPARFGVQPMVSFKDVSERDRFMPMTGDLGASRFAFFFVRLIEIRKGRHGEPELPSAL